MQLIEDKATIADYAEAQPGFGGMFYDEETLVVLFTDDLTRHEQALLPLVQEPTHLQVRRAGRTWPALEEANERVQRQLMGPEHPRSDVVSVGIGVREGDFVIRVGSLRADAAGVADIERLCAPEPVDVVTRTRPQLL
jgi:hypothetical protein